MTERHHVGPGVTSGGGAHDVTGPDAAAHVANSELDATHATADTEHAAAHDEESLGPIDWVAWRAAIVGIVVGVLIIATLYVAIR